MQVLQGLDNITQHLHLAQPKVNQQINVKNETHVQQRSVYVNLDQTPSLIYKQKQNVNVKATRSDNNHCPLQKLSSTYTKYFIFNQFLANVSACVKKTKYNFLIRNHSKAFEIG